MTPVTVITGFLGSGKTTLVNGLLGHPEMEETAVLVNEFGEIGVDHLLVEHLDESTMLIGAGCLCCAVREDLVAGLSSLFERRQSGAVPYFRRVVLETSGLADPAPLLHTLLSDERVNHACSLGGIVTAVDSLNGEHQLARETESQSQAAAADVLVLTKTDMSPATPGLRASLATLNPDARVLTPPVTPADLRISAADVARWLTVPPATRHDGSVTSLSLTACHPLRADRLIAWIERTIACHGDRLLRLKGILDLEGSDVPVAVHGVRHVFHPLERLPSWPSSARLSRIVLIGRDLPADSIRSGFTRAAVSARPVERRRHPTCPS